MKKIVQINILNERGSTGRIMQSISKVIEENAEYQSITAYGYGNSTKLNSYKIGTKLEYYIHNIFSRMLCAQGHYSYFATKRFLKYLETVKPDLIHLHNIHGNYLNYKLLFKYIIKNDIPVVWTLHDCWAFTGKCVHFAYCGCNKWKSECHHCPIIKDYPQSYFLDFTRRDYRIKRKFLSRIHELEIVTPSHWLANLANESYLKGRKINVIHNGIDLDIFKETKTILRKKHDIECKKIILSVASPWSKRKGLDDLRKLSNILDDSYHLVIIGVSDKQKSGFTKNTLLLNKTENIHELVEWYSEADVFFNPSYEDTFPTVNLESLACNTPVIAYNCCGSPEMIQDGCGIVCDPGNLKQVYSAINKIVSRHQDFENGRNTILEFCDESKVYYDYLNIYHKYLREE